MMLTKPTIEEILAWYNLGMLHQATAAYQGNVNETVFIQTDSGLFVLRHNRQHHGAQTHRYRHALMGCLNSRGFPAPRLIPTCEGSTLLNLNRQWYEVQEFVAGTDYDADCPDQVASIGNILARYHTQVRECAQPPGESEPRYSPTRILGLIERVMEADVMGDLWALLAWYDVRIAQIRAALPEREYAQLPHCIIHGDMHPNNLRFVAGDVVALLDYDQVAWDARIVDLADALISFASGSVGATYAPRGVFAGPLDLERTTAIIGAYAAMSSLRPEEIAVLPALVELIWLQEELHWVATALERPAEDRVEVLNQGRWLAEWMRDQREQLVAHWTEVATTMPATLTTVWPRLNRSQPITLEQ